MMRLMWLTCAASLAFSPGSFAQSAANSRAGDWETRLGVTFGNSSRVDFDGGTSADIKSSTGFELGLGYHLTDHLELGGNFLYSQPDYNARIAGSTPDEVWNAKGSLDSSSLMFDATYNFIAGPFTPFVLAGIGWNWTDTNIANGPPQVGCWWDPWWGYICTNYQSSKTLDGFAYQLGAGARYDFNRQFGLSASYKVNWIDLGNAKGTPDFDGFDLGLRWRF